MSFIHDATKGITEAPEQKLQSLFPVQNIWQRYYQDALRRQAMICKPTKKGFRLVKMFKHVRTDNTIIFPQTTQT